MRRVFIVLLAVLLLTSCGDHKTKAPQAKKVAPKQPSVLTIHSKTSAQALYFAGNVSPLKVYSVTSPVDGLVSTMGFSFGQEVKKDQFLLEINSDKIEKTFRDAVTGYLKAKNTYIDSKAKLIGQTALHKDGLVAENEYRTDVGTAASDELAYRQALYTLANTIKQLNIPGNNNAQLLKNLENLSLGDKNINKYLTMQISHIRLKSPREGIALFPSKQTGSNGNGTTVTIGSQAKQGQVLVAIGDMRGIKISINVNEIDINKIKVGQAVIVNGVAFPNEMLKGSVTAVDSQAKSDASGQGLPMFPVTITVPTLTPAQAKVIHVGMSVKVQLTIKSSGEIMVPIAFVVQKDGSPYVYLQLPNGKKKLQAIEAGDTTIDSVIVTKGLKAGDKIVFPDFTKAN
tara:strand:- start:93847 stop:95046 length:1200 start_codon:yes stop_codon:yes gene_type:complete